MTIPIGRFLAEFTLTPPKQGGAPGPQVPVVPTRTEAELAEAIADAHRAGFQAAAAEAERAAAQRDDDRLAAHAAELAAARAVWVENESASLARMLRERLDSLENRIADVAAALLRPILPQAVTMRTVAELRSAITTLLTGSDPLPVLVGGRADLVEALARSFGDHAGVRFQPAEAPDVTILSGDTTIRSALQGWADRFAQELATDR